ncbi:DNRLRE domain-containing protein [Allokutzneria sp. A3M-2-11 16]|uniref:DNRLRE domain-containing protein n=1 Tax=Allokutzneria sp. A3M-2-11 16 TaxID=2962043 RepID=UPI0020B8BF5F|nr:DNRLRE domain-containing protein [Allokutzneria sp. A3M-2-11 16]MCP3805476.1 DNRLRE domain-containing protein [Allokutzneria sp. A3M-2-11 16]
MLAVLFAGFLVVPAEAADVGSMTTETTEVVANPDGSHTWTEHLQPVRVRRGTGWVPVDLKLVKRSDGSIAPAAAPVDLRFSGGGKGNSSPLVVLGRDAREVGLRWRNELPVPVLDGPQATYREVLPGVDLVVRAQVEGFRQVLVVKNAQAAGNPELRKIAFGQHTKDVTVRQVGVARSRTGGLEAVDRSGSVVFSGDATRMWDSSGTASGVVGPGEGGRSAVMGVELSASDIAISPDQGFLADPATTFPVFLDPEFVWHGGKNHHAVVQSAWPDARNYDRTDGDLNELKAGYAQERGRTFDSRSFVEMDSSAMRGKQIFSATLRTRVIHSYGCSGGPTEAWLTGPIGADTTWLHQPAWHYQVANVAVSNNARYCPGHGGAEFDVTRAVHQGAVEGWHHVTIGLRARNEGVSEDWRRYEVNPALVVRYNSPPNEPAELGMEGGLIPCAVGPERPVVFTRTPKLRARLSDPDDGLMDAGFRVLRGPHDNHTWDGNEFRVADVPSGLFAEVQVGSGVIPGHGVFTWHVWAGDYSTSRWSRFCEFEIDTVPPGVPSASSKEYPEGIVSPGVGKQGTFTLKPNGSNDVRQYRYTFSEWQNDEPTRVVDAGRLGGEATVTWTPTKPGSHYLILRSVDRANNLSEILRYEIRVQSA